MCGVVALVGCTSADRLSALDRAVQDVRPSRFGSIAFDQHDDGKIGVAPTRTIGVLLGEGALSTPGSTVEESLKPYLGKAGFRPDTLSTWKRKSGGYYPTVDVSVVPAGHLMRTRDGPRVPLGRTGLVLSFTD